MRAEPVQLTIDRLWDGRPAPAHARVGVSLWGLDDAARDEARVSFDAPFHGDPAPPAPPGRFDTLWEHEVVEVFLANAKYEYLELEFGPHGHYLGLGFRGERNCVVRRMDLEPRFERLRGRWRVECPIPRAHLPVGCDRINAYAIYGAGRARTHLAYGPGDGPRPDFHALSSFVRLCELSGP